MHLCDVTKKRLPDVNDLEAMLHLVRQVTHVLPILFRQEHRLDPSTKCTDQLLLDAAYRRDPATKGNLAL